MDKVADAEMVLARICIGPQVDWARVSAGQAGMSHKPADLPPGLLPCHRRDRSFLLFSVPAVLLAETL